MSLGRLARALLSALALGAPFVVVAQVAQNLLPALSARGVSAIERLTAPLSASPAPPEPRSDSLPPECPTAASRALEVAVTHSPRRGAERPQRLPARGLFVSAATVLKLAQSSARPSGAFVPATAEHPAGLRLSGVAALGVGVEDGDILTEALGVTPRSPEQIVGAIVEARAARVRWLTGALWRRGQTLRLTVEQPYLGASEPG